MALPPLPFFRRITPDRAERAWPSAAFSLPLVEGSRAAALCLDHAPALALEDMLEVMEEKRVTATIFLREDYLTRHTIPLIERAKEEGHEFGLQLVPPTGPRTERPTFSTALVRAHGKIGIFAEPRWFRPPRGFMRPDIMDAPLARWGYAPIPHTERRHIVGTVTDLPAEILRGGTDPKAAARAEKLLEEIVPKIIPGAIIVYPASDPDGIPDVGLKSAVRLDLFAKLIDHARAADLTLARLTDAAAMAARTQLRLADG